MTRPLARKWFPLIFALPSSNFNARNGQPVTALMATKVQNSSQMAKHKEA
jgi:hypothetical protein